jgi:GNAT superfamily N-acetyltransferase
VTVSIKQVRPSAYVPGVIGSITALHATYYSRNWSFGLYFERKVASEMAAFFGRMDPSLDGFWFAAEADAIIGSIAIDAAALATRGAHLRWFIVDTARQGEGIGRRLLDTAMAFCRRRGYPAVYLWTFSGLDAARRLYEDVGFRLTHEQPDDQWGVRVLEQRFEWRCGGKREKPD